MAERTPKLESPTPEVRKRMRATRQTGTSAEMEIRRAAHAARLRYRVDLRPIPEVRSRADMVFTKAKVAVYVDGCFWHRCPLHGTEPKKNSSYWRPKLDANVERDRRTDAALLRAGWTVLRIWEHEAPDAAISRILDALGRPTRRPVGPAAEACGPGGTRSGTR